MKKCTKKIPKHNAGAIVGNSLNFVGDMTQNVVRSQDEGVSFGSVLGGMGKGAATGAALGSVIPGIGTVIGGIGGAIVGGITSAVGQSGSVDENTGKVTKSSGLTRLFGWGRDDEALYAKSNRIITSNVDKQLTPYMNYKFMSDPYNHLNTNVYVNAAEGGIVPGEHYASRREVEVAADGTNAVRYPWDPDGKDTYNVYANPDGSSAMGNYVFTEEGVRRPNGEKYSDAAEKIIKGTEEGSRLRQIELKKLANEMEMQKTKKGIKKRKKDVPAHKDGKGISDIFYDAAVLTQPLWGRAKAEKTHYTLPSVKFMPVAMDFTSEINDVNTNANIARYNIGQRYTNTGAGMAAYLQNANNTVNQLSKIRQYQKNIQNELIGKNVGIYNEHANNITNILNDVYEKDAANRAAARNINRQNLSTSVNNFGQILRDRKLYKMDKLKTDALKPLFEYGYKDYDAFVKWLEENGYGSEQV